MSNKKSTKYLTESELPQWIEKRCPRTFQKITITQEQWERLIKNYKGDAIKMVVDFVGLEIYFIMKLMDSKKKELAMLGKELHKVIYSK